MSHGYVTIKLESILEIGGIFMKTLHLFIQEMKDIDQKVIRLIKKGFLVSFILCLFATFLLISYETLSHFPILYYTGISLFKTSLMFGVTFLICGIAFNTIQKEMH